MTTNPFVTMNEGKADDDVVIPRYPKTTQINVRISDETLIHLEPILNKFSHANKPLGTRLNDIIEQLGVGALHIRRPQDIVDPETNMTTEQCRDAGFQDAIEGNPERFLMMFGTFLPTEFHTAYIRGYCEGAYIKSKGK